MAKQKESEFPGRQSPGLIEARFCRELFRRNGDFRGDKAPASLKQGQYEIHSITLDGFPGRQSPGLIEAGFIEGSI